MKKLLFVGAMALGATACDPEIARDDVQAAGVAEFSPTASPAVVPSPNDLALDSTTGLVNAPIDPKAPAAQQEFTRDYLNTLDGFPPTAIANTKVAGLDTKSVTARTVIVIDLYKGTPLETAAINPLIGYNPDTGYINVIPQDAKTGANAWPKGGRYAVALIGGDNGLKTVDGKNVIASPTWAFASSEKSLVTCEDLTDPTCKTATELIPSTKTDAAERLADQTASALRLEQLRRAYAPLITAVAAQGQALGFTRKDIVLLWTFSITKQPEATFDPSTSVIPFPNDLVRVPATATSPAHLNLPVPAGGGLVAQFIGGLNTLDGFSTTGALVSENSDAKGAIDLGSLDSTTLDASVKVLKLTNATTGTQPLVKPCISCVSSPNADGTPSTAPQQLQLVPQAPLDEATQYGVVLTTGLKDTKGRKVAPAGAFALMRLANPLVANGKSQVSGIPDSIAAQLEPLRLAYKPMFDSLEKAGVPRKNVALAWTFTTQSINSVAKQLYTLPSQIPPATLPNVPVWMAPAPDSIQKPAGFEGRLFAGDIYVPNLLSDPSSPYQGAFNPDPTKLRGERAPFLLAVPPTTVQKPANGWPVVIFAHGLSGSRETLVDIAGKLAAEGFATIAIDSVFHGERSTCAGIAGSIPREDADGTVLPTITKPDAACVGYDFTTPANSTAKCDVTPTSASFGRCVAITQTQACDPTPGKGDVACGALDAGRCVPQKDAGGNIIGGLCEGSKFIKRTYPDYAPAISGWNFLNLVNLFATRDNFRQHLIDMGQLVRVLQSTSPGNFNQRFQLLGLTDTLDSSQIHFVGQSLGGLLGSMSTSVSPAIQKSVLNATGGGLVNVLMTAPEFAASRAGFIGLLESNGIKRGTPSFDQFLGLANTILDPADPRNYGYGLENPSVAVAGREVFVQTVKNDEAIPNAASAALLAAANRPNSTRTVATYMFDPAAYPDAVMPANRTDLFHVFLTYAPAKSLRTAAQTQVVNFLKSGNVVAP